MRYRGKKRKTILLFLDSRGSIRIRLEIVERELMAPEVVGYLELVGNVQAIGRDVFLVGRCSNHLANEHGIFPDNNAFT